MGDATIAEMEMSHSKTKKKLDAHDAPLRALSKQFRLRDKRASMATDFVATDMDNQLEAVKKSVGALKDKCDKSQSILEQMKTSRQQMAEDNKYKAAALKIDDACRKVTPKKAI